MLPPNYDPAPGFPDTRARIDALMRALDAARPGKVVVLSSIGAQAAEPSLLHNVRMVEASFRTLPVPVAFLRPGYFMENASGDVAPAMRDGVVPCFLQPLDHAIPMAATADVGRMGAQSLGETWTGVRVVELEGPRRYSADDVAAGLAAALGRPVRMDPIPRERWESLFRSQGARYPVPRIRMLDGFNEGWIEFEGGKAGSIKGSTSLETVLKELVDRAAPAAAVAGAAR